MNEVFVTWGSLMPELFIERLFVALIGIGMFSHFICMAAAAPVKSPNIVMVFLMTIVGSSIGMFVCAITGQIGEMWALMLSGFASMFLFWLWLWAKGMHVKDFLDKKYGHQ
jgi:hypothetical protein